MTERPLLPALTAIRGIAAWWVVIYHFRAQIGGLDGRLVSVMFKDGYLAVDLFFILSGFVIFLNYYHNFYNITISIILDFMKARLARVYPLYVFISLLYLTNPIAYFLFSKSGSAGGRYDPSYYIMSLFLLQNWGLTDDVKWNIPAWSISTEWFAYLLFPIIAYILIYVAAKVRNWYLIAVSIVIILIISCRICGLSSLGSDIPRFGLLRCVYEFMLGAVVCKMYMSHGKPFVLDKSASLLIFACMFSAFKQFDVNDFIIVPSSFAFLIYGLTDDRSLVVRMLSNSVLVYLGTISYSTYLVHYLIRDWILFISRYPDALPIWLSVTYFIMTFCASVLLYHFIELPGKRLIRGLSFRFRHRSTSRDL